MLLEKYKALYFSKSTKQANYFIALSIVVVCALNVWFLESHILNSLSDSNGILKLLSVTLALSVSPFIAVLSYRISNTNKLLFSSFFGGCVLFAYPLYALYIICYISRDCI